MPEINHNLAIDTNEDVLNMINTFDIPQVSYKFWTTKGKTMGEVERMSFDSKGAVNGVYTKHGTTSILEWSRDGVLIPSTGLLDKGDKMIHIGDLVVCYFLKSDYKVRVVFWDNGWRVIGCTTEEFRANCNQYVSKLGNVWEEPTIYNIYRERFGDVLKELA